MQTRSVQLKRWLFPFLVAMTTAFGVFVLPFFFPPPPLDGVSTANAAGFNNRVAAIAAASISVVVFLLALRRNWMPDSPVPGDYRPLSTRFILIGTALAALPAAIFCRLILTSHFRFTNDTDYFHHQISMHAEYGRKLYDQIEFPYGPLLLYLPYAIQLLLRPFGGSPLAGLLTSLMLMHVIGLLLVVWIINRLPMLYRWRVLMFVIAATHLFEPNFAPNYSLFRFIPAAACIVFLSLQIERLRYAVVLFLSQILCLAISPEMGFAFFAASGALTLWNIYRNGRSWLPCLAAPLAAVPVFLLLVGGGYVRMLALFSRGILNFIVDPQPHVLIFLFALVWLVPPVIALFFQQRRPEAATFGALFILSLGLLPVALARADIGHVYFNQVSIFLLSFVAICYFAPWKQNVWVLTVAIILLTGHAFNIIRYKFELETVIHHNLFGPDAGLSGKAVEAFLRRFAPHVLERELYYATLIHPYFDADRLHRLTHGQMVALPIETELDVENVLVQSGQRPPTFYYFLMGIADHSAEVRQVTELNTFPWILIPADRAPLPTDDFMSGSIGFKHRALRPPYILYKVLYDDLAANWEPVANINGYMLYKNRHIP